MYVWWRTAVATDASLLTAYSAISPLHPFYYAYFGSRALSRSQHKSHWHLPRTTVPWFVGFMTSLAHSHSLEGNPIQDIPAHFQSTHKVCTTTMWYTGGELRAVRVYRIILGAVTGTGQTKGNRDIRNG